MIPLYAVQTTVDSSQANRPEEEIKRLIQASADILSLDEAVKVDVKIEEGLVIKSTVLQGNTLKLVHTRTIDGETTIHSYSLETV